MRQKSGVAVAHYDTDYLARGTHKLPEIHKILLGDLCLPAEGAADPTWEGYCRLYDPGRDFKSCGVFAGLAIHNDTDGSTGIVQAVTENEIYCTLTGGTKANWSYGDQYSVYKTSAYGTKISTIHTDKRFGRKATGKDTLIDGLFQDDIDLDEHGENVFGPGQPGRR